MNWNLRKNLTSLKMTTMRKNLIDWNYLNYWKIRNLMKKNYCLTKKKMKNLMNWIMNLKNYYLMTNSIYWNY